MRPTIIIAHLGKMLMLGLVVSLTLLANLGSAKAADHITMWERDLPIVIWPSDQWYPRAVADGYGGAFVVWWDKPTQQIYVKRINGNGKAVWPFTRVATSAWSKLDFTVVSDRAGGIIVAWAESRVGSCSYAITAHCDIYAQRISGDGKRLWSETGVEVSLTDGNDGFSWRGIMGGIAAIPDSNGGAFIIWHDASSASCCAVFGQRINANGTGYWTKNGIRISPLVQDNEFKDFGLTTDGRRGAIVAWVYKGKTFAQRIMPNGLFAWGAPRVVGRPTDNGYFSIASDGENGALIAYLHAESYQATGIATQRVNASGTPLWGEIGNLILPDYHQFFGLPEVISDGAGGALVTSVKYYWGNSWAERDIFVHRVGATGALQWLKRLTNIAGGEAFPRWLPLRNGGVVVWEDCRGAVGDPACAQRMDLYAQRVTTNGRSLWQENGLPVSAGSGARGVLDQPGYHPYDLVSDGYGGAIIVWPDGRKTQSCLAQEPWSTECDIYSQRISSQVIQ